MRHVYVHAGGKASHGPLSVGIERGLHVAGEILRVHLTLGQSLSPVELLGYPREFYKPQNL